MEQFIGSLIGHELSHTYIQSVAHLEFSGEAGAICEGLAAIGSAAYISSVMLGQNTREAPDWDVTFIKSGLKLGTICELFNVLFRQVAVK